MTSKSKGQTDNTLQSSYAVKTEAKGPQSKPSVSMDNTPTYTPTSSQQSKSTLTTGRNVSEKSRQHAAILKVVLSRLEKDGLIRRFKVLSKAGTTQEIQVVFDNSIWTEDLELRSGNA